MKTPFSQTGIHKFLRRLVTLVLITSTGFFASAAEEAPEVELDPISGMIIDDHWQTVQAMCSVCHSPKLFTNYGATRETWASLIDWMQEKQGLWPIPPEIENNILTYLEKNYPPGEVSRRRNLAASMRPPNPYVSAVKAEFEEKLQKGEITRPELDAQ